MRVRFWGVRGSTPTPQKENMGFGGNTSCIEVRTDSNEILIFDGGTGIRLLGKELEKVEKDIAVIEARLGNPGFVAKAPEEVLEEARERRSALAAQRGKFKEALNRLN